MILQRIQFPRPDICARELMFFRPGVQAIVESEPDNNHVAFQRGSQLETNTYFNSFSIGKWKKYSQIEDLSICFDFKGSFWVDLISLTVFNGRPVYRPIGGEQIDSKERGFASIKYSELPDEGVVSFTLTALTDDSEYYGGYYETSDTFEPRDVSIAIGICTFQREDDVSKNASNLTKEIFHNPESIMYKKCELFISDNGQTIDSSVENECVHLFANKNTGGAGGFTRVLMEILNSKKSFSHVLLMDDDILFNPEAIERTYTFLRCIKEEYVDAFIGGHMLRNEEQNRQQEAADCWDLVRHHAVKYMFNLELERDIAENEIEDTLNYFSWWYCCMPIEVVNDYNLPLPFFIKRDDVEYGLRNGNTFITLNGICVWHEAFEGKESAHLQYYYYRNLCIMDSLHRPSFNKQVLKDELDNTVLKKFLWRYEYKKAELALLGVQHFLNGFDWFKQLEPEGLNSALMKMNYQKLPRESFGWTFQYRDFTNNLRHDEGFLERLYYEYVRKATFNGWFLPKKNNEITPVSVSDVRLYYRADRVLNYDEISDVAYITQKDWGCFFEIMKMYHETLKMIDERFDDVQEEFRERYSELITADFWNEYLSRGYEEYDISSRLTELNRPRNTPEQRNDLINSYVSRAVEKVNPFLKIDDRLVVFAVPNRRGVTCNPKYILEGLYNKYGDTLNYYWVSDFPDACDFGSLPVTVVETNSEEHKKVTKSAKIYITNDGFPAWAEHKKGQTWINTWHGAINFKHIGYDYIVTRSTFSEKLFELENREANYYFSASEAFSKDFAESFRVNVEKFVPLGYPRNDMFFGADPELISSIRNKLGLEDDAQVALFAPTFRIGWKTQTFGMDFDRLKVTLEKRFGGDWYVLFRNHSFIRGRKYQPGVIDVSDYDDMNELLLVSDVLISDYSSCMYDFSLQKKPCFVFATDMASYEDFERGFAIPPEEWPYPIATDNDGLEAAIQGFDEQEYADRLNAFYTNVGAYDDGHATERAVELIASILEDVEE